MKPLVSILMPAFNAEEWIADTIKSAIGQTWQRKEIIIVDDGSTDRTLEVARQFASREVVVVTQENQGASAARNKAFSISQGEYIQWLDADDLLSSEKIARQMAVAETCQDSRIVLSSAWGRFLSRVRRAQFIPTRLWCDLSPAEWMIRKMSENLFMQTATWLVSQGGQQHRGPLERSTLRGQRRGVLCSRGHSQPWYPVCSRSPHLLPDDRPQVCQLYRYFKS